MLRVTGNQVFQPKRKEEPKSPGVGDQIDPDMERASATPFSFYGKVVDEENNPISGASIFVRLHNKPWGSGTIERYLRDESGAFYLKNKIGAAASDE